MLLTLSFMHGEFYLETSSLAEEYTSCCTVFKQVPRERQTCGSELTNRAPFDKGLPARNCWPDSATVSDCEHFASRHDPPQMLLFTRDQFALNL